MATSRGSAAWRNIRILTVAPLALLAASQLSAKPPENWDGLVKVPARQVDLLYLRPGADFRSYTSILLDTPQVAFQKNWQRDYNRTASGLSGRISDSDVRKAIDGATDVLNQQFSSAFQQAGYALVSAPSEQTMRVTVGVLNVRVNAPDKLSPGRSYSFSNEAGEATLVIEVRDSLSNELLGRAVDLDEPGDTSMAWRNRASNRADFEAMFARWAKISARGLEKLKASSPSQPAARR